MKTSNLNKNRMYYANKEGKYGTARFNCWGATLFVLGIRDRLVWLRDFEMNKFLNEHTHPVEKEDLERGDILVMEWISGSYVSLEHTAVYLGHGKFFHKRGMNSSEIIDIDGVRATYPELNERYRRMI